MNEDLRITLKRKGFVLQPDGSYAKAAPVAAAVQMPVLEFPVRDNTVGPSESARERRPRIRVCVTSYSRRPLDDCNFSTKAIVDCIRYAGIVLDDNWGNLRVVPEQKEVEREDQEGTEILITEEP